MSISNALFSDVGRAGGGGAIPLLSLVTQNTAHAELTNFRLTMLSPLLLCRRYAPGSYVWLCVPSISWIPHPYSISSVEE